MDGCVGRWNANALSLEYVDLAENGCKKRTRAWGYRPGGVEGRAGIFFAGASSSSSGASSMPRETPGESLEQLRCLEGRPASLLGRNPEPEPQSAAAVTRNPCKNSFDFSSTTCGLGRIPTTRASVDDGNRAIVLDGQNHRFEDVHIPAFRDPEADNVVGFRHQPAAQRDPQIARNYP